MIVMKRRGAESDGRERLMDAAFALFTERGYDGVAIHEIAEAAGMTRAAPYYHFQNKEDLFIEVILREMQRLTARAAAVVRDAPTFRDELVAILETFFASTTTSVGRFIADVKQNLGPASLRRFETCHRETMAILQDVFERGHAAGEYSRVSPETAVQIFFSLMVGYMEIARKDADFIQPVDGCSPPTPEVMVGVLLSGI